jgi:hypothetical protein
VLIKGWAAVDFLEVLVELNYALLVPNYFAYAAFS